MERFLDFDGGLFIEAGANDGYAQSNTYYFEAMRGWRGLLIEPLPDLASECRRNRPRSKVVQAALVPPGFGRPHVTVQVGGLTSTVEGAFGDVAACKGHHRRGLDVQGLPQLPPIEAPARVLSDLVDEHFGMQEIDLLVLDVEGFEIEALRGLNLNRHVPRFACIECRDRAAVTRLLSPRMRPVEVLHENPHYADVLFARDDRHA